jgi:hypothetical protein
MSKTTEIQIEKSRNLIEGLRRVEKDPEGLLSAGTLARLWHSRQTIKYDKNHL